MLVLVFYQNLEKISILLQFYLLIVFEILIKELLLFQDHFLNYQMPLNNFLKDLIVKMLNLVFLMLEFFLLFLINLVGLLTQDFVIFELISGIGVTVTKPDGIDDMGLTVCTPTLN